MARPPYLDGYTRTAPIAPKLSRETCEALGPQAPGHVEELCRIAEVASQAAARRGLDTDIRQAAADAARAAFDALANRALSRRDIYLHLLTDEQLAELNAAITQEAPQ